MHITRIHAQLKRSKINVKRLLPNADIQQKVKNTAVKKIIPTTMLIAESLNPFWTNAQTINKNILAFADFKPKIISDFVPRIPKETDKPLLMPMRINLIPRNKFNKLSYCLKEKYNGTIEELDYFIEKLIPKRKGKKDYNPFYQKGESFIEIGKKYNINPTVLIAIGMQESGRGTSLAAVTRNNIGGIYIKNQHKSFDTVEECIEIMAKILINAQKKNILQFQQSQIQVNTAPKKSVNYGQKMLSFS